MITIYSSPTKKISPTRFRWEVWAIAPQEIIQEDGTYTKSSLVTWGYEASRGIASRKGKKTKMRYIRIEENFSKFLSQVKSKLDKNGKHEDILPPHLGKRLCEGLTGKTPSTVGKGNYADVAVGNKYKFRHYTKSNYVYVRSVNKNF